MKHFEIIKTALTISYFEKLIYDYKIIDARFYLSRPIFKLRYNLPTIRVLKNPFALGAEYLLRKNNE